MFFAAMPESGQPKCRLLRYRIHPSSRVAKMLLEYAQEIYVELLCARQEDRALDESFAWSLFTLSEFISGFGDGEMRDIDAEIATWGREK